MNNKKYPTVAEYFKIFLESYSTEINTSEKRLLARHAFYGGLCALLLNYKGALVSGEMSAQQATELFTRTFAECEDFIEEVKLYMKSKSETN